jgi:hypothetical protein
MTNESNHAKPFLPLTRAPVTSDPPRLSSGPTSIQIVGIPLRFGTHSLPGVGDGIAALWPEPHSASDKLNISPDLH